MYGITGMNVYEFTNAGYKELKLLGAQISKLHEGSLAI